MFKTFVHGQMRNYKMWDLHHAHDFLRNITSGYGNINQLLNCSKFFFIVLLFIKN